MGKRVIAVVGAVVGLVVLAPRVSADEPAPGPRRRVLAGVGAGHAEYGGFNDPGFGGWHLTGVAGLGLARHLGVLIRVSHHAGDQDDAFDIGLRYHHRMLRVIPMVRLDSGYVWIEAGAGYVADTVTRSDTGTSRDQDHLTLATSVGCALGPRAWPVRPHLEAGLNHDFSVTAWAGLAVVYQPRW